MRLIDAEALGKWIEDEIKAIEDREPVMAMAGIGCLNMVKRSPTIEAEPVVLCGYCIYNARNTDGVAVEWCYKHGIDIASDDYCSYGEEVVMDK